MRIGVPKEIKNHEYRIGLTPAGVKELVKLGHQVAIQSQAGTAVGFEDALFQQAGATIVQTAEAVFSESELIIKVKEPQPHECELLNENQLLFTFLHLAPDPVQTECLLKSGASAIAYETITADDGSLPLLTPMSEIAGRMSIQAGAHSLENAQGGKGVLLSGVPGVPPAKVMIIGGGTVGINAARMAIGLGADVTLLDKSLKQLQMIDEQFGTKIKTVFSSSHAIEEYIQDADLIIGAVLVPGATTPKLISQDMLKLMKKGTVLVDVAIDQGGCFETSKPTTHTEPCYEVDGIIHYCVSNMPGAVARTATLALSQASLPYIIQLAEHGLDALRLAPHFRQGLNIHQGQVCNKAVADALGYAFVSAESALNIKP